MVIKRTSFKDFHLMYIETPTIFDNKTHKIKVFGNLFLCVFVILKIFGKLSSFRKPSLYSMKIKEQTRKLAAGCT